MWSHPVVNRLRLLEALLVLLRVPIPVCLRPWVRRQAVEEHAECELSGPYPENVPIPAIPLCRAARRLTTHDAVARTREDRP